MHLRKYVRYVCGILPKVSITSHKINKYARHPEKTTVEKKYKDIHKLLKSTMKNFKIEFIVGGAENIPENTNVLFVSNHQSMMDAVSFLGYFERPVSFLSKIEVKKYPIIGKIVTGLDGVFMDRSNMRQEIKSIRRVTELLENNPERSFIIFPEGTRTKDKDYKIGEFKAGALKPAYRANKPIIPIAIYGTFRILNPNVQLKRYPVQIQFLKPHNIEEFDNITTTEMSDIIHDEIAREVERMHERDEKLLKKYKKGKLVK